MKKKILVRHRNTNGDAVVLQRKVRPWYFLWLISGWRDWRLLNTTLYKKETEIKKSCEKLQKLLKERQEEIEYLKREKKDVAQATMQTYGFGAPFYMTVNRSELKESPKSWPKKVNEEWRKVINPIILKGERAGRKDVLRDKIDGRGGRQDFSQKTAYTMTEDSKHIPLLSENNPEYDTILGYRDNNNRNKKDRNNNNNQNNNRNRNNNDDD